MHIFENPREEKTLYLRDTIPSTDLLISENNDKRKILLFMHFIEITTVNARKRKILFPRLN